MCHPIAGAVISGVGSVFQTMEQRKAVAAKNRANQIATNNRNTIKIAKNREDNVNLAKTADANYAGIMAALGAQDISARRMSSELSQADTNSLIKIMKDARGMEGFGNTATRLQNAGWQEEGKVRSALAHRFTSGIEATEMKKESLLTEYNANLRTGNPLVLESDPIPQRAPSLLPTFLGAAGDVWTAKADYERGEKDD